MILTNSLGKICSLQINTGCCCLQRSYSSIELFVLSFFFFLFKSSSVIARSHSKLVDSAEAAQKITKTFSFEFADGHAPETQHKKDHQLELCPRSNMRRITILNTEVTAKLHQFNQHHTLDENYVHTMKSSMIQHNVLVI